MEQYIQFDINNHIGETTRNNNGSLCTIIKYNNSHDIDIKISSTLSTGEYVEYISYNKGYSNFRTGQISSPYECTIYGVGCIGEGEHNKSKDYIAYSWHIICFVDAILILYKTDSLHTWVVL